MFSSFWLLFVHQFPLCGMFIIACYLLFVDLHVVAAKISFWRTFNDAKCCLSSSDRFTWRKGHMEVIYIGLQPMKFDINYLPLWAFNVE